MKRKIIIVGIILIIITMTYGLIYSNEITKFGLNEIIIESFDETGSFFKISKEDESDFNFFISLINESEKSAIDNSNIQPSHQVKFKTNTKEKTYWVDVDVLNKSVAIYDAEKEYSYSIAPNTSDDIMLHPAFSSAYTYNKPPEIVIDDSNNPVLINEYNFDWNYKKIDDQWYQPDTPIINVENTEPFVINKQNQNIEVSFDVEPEILTYKIFDN